jgi:hypothetical protein
VLYYTHGLTQKDIADRLGLARSTPRDGFSSCPCNRLRQDHRPIERAEKAQRSSSKTAL